MTRSPLRVSFFGGGTDFPEFYENNGGFFLSTAIDKYIYCTVKRHSTSFLENFRLNYSDTELVNEIGLIKNDIIRASLERYESENGAIGRLYIGTIGDVRSNSGLGSSSAFAAALDLALANLVSPQEKPPSLIAKRACELELNILNKPIGIQDQWATAVGGLNAYTIRADGEVEITNIKLKADKLETLNSCLVLIDTGISRNAESITRTYSSPTINQERNLVRMMEDAKSFTNELQNQNGPGLAKFLGEALHSVWQLKQELHESVTNRHIKNLYSQLISIGCIGGKLLGAGGGGYLLMVVEPSKREEVAAKVSNLGLLLDFPRISESQTEVLARC